MFTDFSEIPDLEEAYNYIQFSRQTSDKVNSVVESQTEYNTRENKLKRNEAVFY